MTLIQELKKWLDTPGNSRTTLAHILKYKSTATIDRWLTKGNVPERERERVAEIIKSGSKESKK